jgi:hypothetical protein
VFAFVTVGNKENQNSLAGAFLRINCASTVTSTGGAFSNRTVENEVALVSRRSGSPDMAMA